MVRLLLALACALALAGCHDARTPPDEAPVTPRVSVSPRPAPTGPHQVGRVLRRVEKAIARGSATDADARRQEVAYRRWSDHPGWDATVLAALPADLRHLARQQVAVRRALRSIYPTRAGSLPDHLPAWRIDPPDPLADLVADYHLAQRHSGVDWQVLAAINFVETDFGRITGTSTAGAQGPMQFIPATWAAYGQGGDIHDPHDAILGAGRLLAANGFAEHPVEALHHYNNSDGYVRAVTLLARILRDQPHELSAFHAWQVYYLTSRGPVRLPSGYDEPRPVPVKRWLAGH